MRSSTLVLAIGTVVFLLPVPGTFIGGAVILLVGFALRWYGS